MPRFPNRVLAVAVAAWLAAVALLVLARPAAAGSWRRPVAGEVVGAFRYSARRPFAAGWRRGVDIAARPGAVVHAACGGRVSFAGPLPGAGAGRGVSVHCGALTATHLGLAGLAVRRGAMVAAGGPVGTLGPSGLLRLGARVTARRFGYVDPLRLLGGEPWGPPAAGPRRRGGRGPRPAPGPAPALGRAPRPHAVPAAPLAAPAAAPRPLPAPTPGRGVPAVAWAGLVLFAAGLPLGGVIRRRARRRRRLLCPTQPGRGLTS
jgi:Peptidase family M23